MITLVKQYTVFLPNRPGALHSFIELFEKENIEIIGISSEIHDESGIIKIAVDSNKKLSYILTSAGFATLETTLISITLKEKKDLINLTRILGENEINITTIYGTMGSSFRILLNVSDIEKTLKILEENFNQK